MLTSGRVDSFAGLPRRLGYFCGGIFLVAFVVYAWAWKEAPVEYPDSASYQRMARDLADLRLDEPSWRTPGYPLLLLATGSAERPRRALFHVSLVLFFVSVWLLATVLRRAGLSEVAVAAFVVVTCLPPFVEPAAWMLTEQLSQFVLVTGMAALISGLLRASKVRLGIASVALGAVGLVRPNFALLPLALAAVVPFLTRLAPWARIRRRMALGAALALLAGAFLVEGGYAFMNYRFFSYFGISSQSGYALSIKTVAVLERLPDRYAEVREALIRSRDAELTKRGSSHTGYSYVNHMEPELSRITGLEGAELSRFIGELNWLLIRRAPLHFLEEVAKAAARYWLPSAQGPLAAMGTESLRIVWVLGHAAVMAIFVAQLVVVLGAGAALRMGRLRPQRSLSHGVTPGAARARAIAYPLALTAVFYTPVVTCLFSAGDGRYRVPTDSLILLLCFLGTAMARSLIRPEPAPES